MANTQRPRKPRAVPTPKPKPKPGGFNAQQLLEEEGPEPFVYTKRDGSEVAIVGPDVEGLRAIGEIQREANKEDADIDVDREVLLIILGEQHDEVVEDMHRLPAKFYAPFVQSVSEYFLGDDDDLGGSSAPRT